MSRLRRGCIAAVRSIAPPAVGIYSETDLISSGGGLLDEGEDIEQLELPLGRALTMIASGEICDAKTIMLLQFAALHLRPSGQRVSALESITG